MIFLSPSKAKMFNFYVGDLEKGRPAERMRKMYCFVGSAVKARALTTDACRCSAVRGVMHYGKRTTRPMCPTQPGGTIDEIMTPYFPTRLFSYFFFLYGPFVNGSDVSFFCV